MDKPLKNTLAIIESQHLRPEPKYRYWLKKYSVWLSFFLVALLSAVCVSVIYYLVSQLDWDLYQFSNRNLVSYVLTLLPYLWIVPFLLLFMLTLWNFRQTENGYRLSNLKILLLTFIILIFFSGLASAFNWDKKLNGFLINHSPQYPNYVTTKEKQWSQPEQGFLSGTIEETQSQSLDLVDLKGKQWQINMDENTLVRPAAQLKAGEKIKTIGKQTGSNSFSAQEIRPWEGRGKMMSDCQSDGNSNAKNSAGQNKKMMGRQK